MAYYLVTARATGDLTELRARLDRGEIRTLRPFGRALHASLSGARLEGDRVVWEELDHCTPPLAMERAAVLDRYFADIATEAVREGEGWARIDHLPPLWTRDQEAP
jgi:hypothetical protein